MKFEHGYKTYKEARSRAIELLSWAPDIQRDGDKFTLHWHETKFYSRIGDIAGEPPGVTFTAENTRAAVGIEWIEGPIEERKDPSPIPGLEKLSGMKEKTYSIVYLSPEEADPRNRTHNFMDFDYTWLSILPFMAFVFFRPVKELTPAKAYTIEGMRIVNEYYGDEFPLFDTTSGERTEKAAPASMKIGGEDGEALREKFHANKKAISERLTNRSETDKALEEALARAKGYPTLKGNDHYLRILPGEISSVYGIELPDLESYFAALCALCGINRAKEVILRNIYLSARAFLRYALYELARTESYPHLREVLHSYRAFYLPPQWEALYLQPILNYINPLPKETPKDAETAVLSRYLSLPASSTCDMREISAYLKAPIEEVYRAAGFTNRYF